MREFFSVIAEYPWATFFVCLFLFQFVLHLISELGTAIAKIRKGSK